MGEKPGRWEPFHSAFFIYHKVLLFKLNILPDLFQTRVDGVRRGMFFYHGTAGSIRCRKAAHVPHGRKACIHDRIARASGGQGYFQHGSTTEPYLITY